MVDLNLSKTKFFIGSLVEYIDFVYSSGKSGERVLLSTSKGVPVNVHTIFNLYFRNGIIHSYQGWTQFIEVLHECGKEGKEVNVAKIGKDLLTRHPEFEVREVVVEYFPLYGSSSVQDYIDSLPHWGEVTPPPEKPEFSLGHVRSQAKKLSAKNFKSWLRKYLNSYNIPYKFKNEVGVQKLLSLLEKWLVENKDKLTLDK